MFLHYNSLSVISKIRDFEGLVRILQEFENFT